MESPPPLETVYQAVVTLYNNKNFSETEQASKWLAELQKSVYSWKIADDMLQQKRDFESCYFAAQTMRTKIQYSFHELPAESHTSLRDSLIQHLEQMNDLTTNSVIITQLCLGLAALSLQMSSWEKPILDLISRFGERFVWPLLEIMTALPEEVNSESLRLGDNRRQQICNELSTCSPTVIEYLKMCLRNTDDPQIHTKVFRCFTSWVSVKAISLNDVTDNLIVIHAFNILQNNHQSYKQLHGVATDCVCKLLQTLEDNNNQLALEEQLFRGVMALEDSYHLAVAHEDDEGCMNYCRIFTELGESFLDKIVKNSSSDKSHYALKVLDLVLMCVGHHEYEVAEITFNLWYRLSEDLYEKNDDSLTLVFKPYVERLIESLCRHSRMEPDHEGLLHDADDFSDFRSKVSELIKDVVFIVGSSNCFRQMFLSLQSPQVTWDTTEAALFIMQAVAKNIIPHENDVVPQVIKAILALEPESSHIAVRHTSILLLGELCDWIEQHSDDTLNPVLYFLFCSLRQPQLASASANALKLICSACRDKMAQHFNVLALQIVEALNSPSISSEAAIVLLKGVSLILPKIPANEVYTAMKSLCWVQVEPLQKLNESNVENKKGTSTDPVIYLDRLAAIFRHTKLAMNNNQTNPFAAVFTEMWPVLSETCNRYQSDLRVMERCCRCLRFAVRCVGQQSSHLLQPIVEQIVSLYNIYKHSCFLYLGSILVDVFACEAQNVPGLLKMLEAFIQPTFDILQEENGLRNHPDTVDDFFRLCARFLQRIPTEFLQRPALLGILQCALMACSLDHRDANASIMKFFCDLVFSGKDCTEINDVEKHRRQLVSAIIQSHGKQLISNLIEASVFSLHSYMLSGVADVLMEVLENDRNAVNQWLEAALKSLPTHNSGGAATATQAQLQKFHESIMRAQSSKEITHALKEFTRLYR
ncbi:UNVERIFIED_CONTAM: hypothetical protein PYX00_009490 [Menopon gallinae]|uniref:Transportin-3 n=1 Tax=Menopon gallinae TaxID=328185 RepID=A0AAW2HBF1_9NEOP